MPVFIVLYNCLISLSSCIYCFANGTCSVQTTQTDFTLYI